MLNNFNVRTFIRTAAWGPVILFFVEHGYSIGSVQGRSMQVNIQYIINKLGSARNPKFDIISLTKLTISTNYCRLISLGSVEFLEFTAAKSPCKIYKKSSSENRDPTLPILGWVDIEWL